MMELFAVLLEIFVGLLDFFLLDYRSLDSESIRTNDLRLF